MISAKIITIGDELLIGQVIDTNSAWLAEKLNELGVEVKQRTAVGDDREMIFHALDTLLPDTRLVILTGGLGPTRDDITKKTLAEYFGMELTFHEETLRHITEIFNRLGREVNELNASQAWLPSGCIPLKNWYGTAPGMQFERNGVHYFSLPGVPYEMKALFENYIRPFVAEKLLPDTQILHAVFHTQGIPESILAKRIEAWELQLPPQIKLAYLPSAGAVRLRLTARGSKNEPLEELLKAEGEKLKQLLGVDLYAEGDEPLEKVIGQLLKSSGKTLALAESCTGGYIAHLITSVPGSSAYFMGGIVSYDYVAKEVTLGVHHSDILQYGAVSSQVVLQMAEGAKRVFGTDYALSASGIAGPDGGTDEKPVGTVWIGISTPHQTRAYLYRFGNDRMRNIRKTALAALDLLRRALTGASLDDIKSPDLKEIVVQNATHQNA
ncbi:CinA-like protein [Thermaurantimonas aggregans]|uniref:CinA-like protein n=1 Tax=Thermaurantimonas aggregans TaxID=2173829 RepID=A0A401XJQ2_9FLAO|nr:competence/damage-inducible protein A [Thermaurantimonas aggregans]MCX8149255.1 competence/damage-inducible protein A [Thermaurantimonas aggregans]GCD77238.1 CinA-like protein [Thermaurantimonas aggregans]